MSDQINVFSAAWQVWRGTHARRPDPTGTATYDHGSLKPVLAAVAEGGVAALSGVGDELEAYRRGVSEVDPDELDREQALAFWINVYNAESLTLVASADESGLTSVLRAPGAFSRPRVTIAGEELSLSDIEHGKVRRFGDPRIHSALVCGTVSCPTLRYEPFDGHRVSDQLEDQMRVFLASGGAEAEGAVLRLSRVLQWYGADFARPHSMPGWIPPRKRRLVEAISPWLDPNLATWARETSPKVEFQRYDWGVGCAVR